MGIVIFKYMYMEIVHINGSVFNNKANCNYKTKDKIKTLSLNNKIVRILNKIYVEKLTFIFLWP